MKRAFFLCVAFLCFLSCKKDSNTASTVEGRWKLDSAVTDVYENDILTHSTGVHENGAVYDFQPDDTLSIYVSGSQQKLRYEHPDQQTLVIAAKLMNVVQLNTSTLILRYRDTFEGRNYNEGHMFLTR